MNKCENCGYENDDEDTVCKQCHYLLKEIKNQEKMDKPPLNNEHDDALSLKNNDNTTNNIDNYNIANNYEDKVNSYRYDDGYFLLDNIESISEENRYNYSKKSIALGCLLSFFITGMGNVYAGLTKRGIIEFIISLIINSFIPITPEYFIDFNSFVVYIALIWEVYVLYDTYRCIKAINNNQEIPLLLKFNIK